MSSPPGVPARGAERGDPLVLIVDDNEKNRKLAGDVLRAAGFRTLEAGTAAEDLVATEHLPDVILMDLQLPDMDGTDAAQSLADGRTTARIPVVALSAHRLERDDDRFSPRVRRLPSEADRRRRFAEQVRKWAS